MAMMAYNRETEEFKRELLDAVERIKAAPITLRVPPLVVSQAEYDEMTRRLGRAPTEFVAASEVPDAP